MFRRNKDKKGSKEPKVEGEPDPTTVATKSDAEGSDIDSGNIGVGPIMAPPNLTRMPSNEDKTMVGSKMRAGKRRLKQRMYNTVGSHGLDDSEFQARKDKVFEIRSNVKEFAKRTKTFLGQVRGMCNEGNELGEFAILIGTNDQKFAKAMNTVENRVRGELENGVIQCLDSLVLKLKPFEELERRCELRRRCVLDVDSYTRKVRALKENPKADPNKVLDKEQKLLSAKERMEKMTSDLYQAFDYYDVLRGKLVVPELMLLKRAQVRFFAAAAEALGAMDVLDPKKVTAQLEDFAREQCAKKQSQRRPVRSHAHQGYQFDESAERSRSGENSAWDHEPGSGESSDEDDYGPPAAAPPPPAAAPLGGRRRTPPGADQGLAAPRGQPFQLDTPPHPGHPPRGPAPPAPAPGPGPHHPGYPHPHPPPAAAVPHDPFGGGYGGAPPPGMPPSRQPSNQMQGGYPNFHHSQGVAQSSQSFNHLQQQQRPEHQTMGFHDPFSMGREDGGGGAAASILPQAVPVNHHQTHGQQLPSTQQSNINVAQPQNSSTPFFDPFAEAPQLAAASTVSRNTSSFGQNPTSSQQPVAEQGINNTQYQSFLAGPPAANDILSGFPAAMSDNLPDGPGPVVLQPAVNAITARALYSYNATDSTELSFVEGELLVITSQDDSGWWQGHSQQNPASIGLLPSNYVKII